jgi:hypothetical protein
MRRQRQQQRRHSRYGKDIMREEPGSVRRSEVITNEDGIADSAYVARDKCRNLYHSAIVRARRIFDYYAVDVRYCAISVAYSIACLTRCAIFCIDMRTPGFV